MSVVSAELLSSTSSASDPGKTHFAAFVITFPVFMGYACCFSLQKNLSLVIGLAEGVSGNSVARVFGVAVTFVYLFNLIFRVFGHNVVFGLLGPRHRIVCALLACVVSMTILAVVGSRPVPPYASVAWVFVAYAFMGVCEGSYCPNMLNIVNHMGATRTWVVVAIPCGVATITIAGFLLIAIGVPYYALYAATAAFAALSLVLYLATLYRVAAGVQIDAFDLHQFLQDLKNVRQWFPKIWLHSLVFIVDMLCLSLFSPGATLYAYSSRVTYRLFGFTTSHDTFMVTYNLGSFLGDLLSRQVMSRARIVSPLWFALLLMLAFAMVIALIPEIAPLASFGFSWANGGLYTQITTLIGDLFPGEYHLTAISTWLFLGDVGSTTGSLVIQQVRPGIADLKAVMY